jgi:hypothetical protein
MEMRKSKIYKAGKKKARECRGSNQVKETK